MNCESRFSQIDVFCFRKGNKKKGKKKGKKKENEASVLTGNENTSQVEEEEEEEEPVETEVDLVKYKHYFRELDIDVWLILTQPLTFAPTPEKVFIRYLHMNIECVLY